MGYDISNIIIIGPKNYPLYRFDNRSIVLNSLSGVFSVDVIGNELSVDTFSVTIRYDPTQQLVYAPVDTDGYLTTNPALYGLQTVAGRDYMTELPYGTPVFWYCDGKFFTKGYLQSCERIGKYAWKLTAISGIGLLANEYHEGGVYNYVKAGSIISDIIGDTFPHRIFSDVTNTRVNGWLPYDTRRNNLHRILFALGVALVKGTDAYDYLFTYLREEDEPPTIPDGRIALGGSVKFNLPATQADIAEHAYFQTANDPTETLYENTDETDRQIHTVVFDAPHYDLEASGGLVIHSSGANVARVSGGGVLTGKKYTHTERLVTETTGAASAPQTKTVESNGLISTLNSRNVALRVLSYFSSAKTVKAKLLYNGEKTGQQYSFNDPFGDAMTGFLQKMSFGVTSLKAAECEFVEGYAPAWQGNFYNNRVFITTSGTWEAPEGVRNIRIVLVGGGSGGDGGYNGADGMGGDDMEYVRHAEVGEVGNMGWRYSGGDQPAAAGGEGGASGTAGTVFVEDYEIEEGETLTFAIGAGGAGGAVQGGAGSAGSPTSVSSTSVNASSDDGDVLTNGYYDPFVQKTFGAPGVDGVAGADGGQTDLENLFSTNGKDGFAGGDLDTRAGGAGGVGVAVDLKDLVPSYGIPRGVADVQMSGGGGGGAAYGANGGAGGNWNLITGETWEDYHPQGGAGGDGADAVAPASAYYGGGGNGGNGGGGGGNAGGSSVWWDDPWSITGFVPVVNYGGSGGAGTAGRAGGAGCAIIYY